MKREAANGSRAILDMSQARWLPTTLPLASKEILGPTSESSLTLGLHQAPKGRPKGKQLLRVHAVASGYCNRRPGETLKSSIPGFAPASSSPPPSLPTPGSRAQPHDGAEISLKREGALWGREASRSQRRRVFQPPRRRGRARSVFGGRGSIITTKGHLVTIKGNSNIITIKGNILTIKGNAGPRSAPR